MNKVLLTGRLTRDPEMRSLASGKNVTTFTVASNEFLGVGKEKAEYSPIVTWDRLAEIAGQYLGKGQQVAIEGRLQTRSWDDDRGQRHWKTEIVASRVEMLSGRRKKDYEAQQAAESLTAQAEALGEAPASEPIPEGAEATGEPAMTMTTRPRPTRPPPDRRAIPIGHDGARPLPCRRDRLSVSPSARAWLGDLQAACRRPPRRACAARSIGTTTSSAHSRWNSSRCAAISRLTSSGSPTSTGESSFRVPPGRESRVDALPSCHGGHASHPSVRDDGMAARLLTRPRVAESRPGSPCG